MQKYQKMSKITNNKPSEYYCLLLLKKSKEQVEFTLV